MTAITFDTLKFVEKLKAAGVPEAHAKAEAEALVEALGAAEVATKRDIEKLDAGISNRFERLEGELKLNRWMLGILMAGVMSLILKAFF
ncbi:MAG: DUF1640 domain-containing protein [Alphaproteobacteria bacterium]|nr:DUF1640 domain-containing protein [Alphaproteobacteria bacterium]